MFAVQGYFKAGQFIGDTPVQIPDGKKTIVTVLDESVNEERNLEAHKKLWDDIIEGLRNCDEPLDGEPEGLRFRTPEETEAL